jgi:hypothetical protein
MEVGEGYIQILCYQIENKKEKRPPKREASGGSSSGVRWEKGQQGRSPGPYTPGWV